MDAYNLKLNELRHWNTELTEYLAEAVYILEHARTKLPLATINGKKQRRSALVARLDALIDKIDEDLGEEFQRLVKQCGM